MLARDRLQTVAAALLDRDAPPTDLARAAHDLYVLLSELAGLDEASRSPDELDSIQLPTGRALAPRDAARSTVDIMRTARMLQGLEAAVAEAAHRFGPPVELLYAGCGPLAPLFFPLAARLGPAALKGTLLDAHARSVQMAAAALAALGLEACVRRLVVADATAYRHEGPLHVVVCEALERALEREPQLAITINLAPQVAPGGLFVPERIAVDACLADPGREVVSALAARESRGRAELGRVFELTLETARAFAGGGTLPRAVVDVPALGPGDPTCLMLRTSVDVFGPVALAERESGITYPALQHALGRVPGRSRVEIAYVPGRNPCFACRIEGGLS